MKDLKGKKVMICASRGGGKGIVKEVLSTGVTIEGGGFYLFADIKLI